MRWYQLILALALAALAAPSAAQMKSTNQSIRAAKAVWLTRDYPAAYTRLNNVRKLPYGRTVEVDFMLATSACQTGRRPEGLALLAGLLANKSLKPGARGAVRQQIGHCQGSGGGAPVIVLVSGSSPSTSGGYGKTFYWLDKNSPIASYPAIRKTEIDPAALDARLHARADGGAALRADLTSRGCQTAIGTYVAVCSINPAIGQARLDRIAAEADAFVRFLETAFGIAPAAEYVTVRLVPGVYDVRRLAERLHGLDVSPSTIAYSFRDDLAIVAASQGNSGSVLHELAHLAMRRDFGDAPQWFEEGFASLYEVAVRCGDRFDGVDNWRGDLLRRDWRAAPPLDRIVADEAIGTSGDTADQTAEDRPAYPAEGTELTRALVEAKMRYLVLLLQERGQLPTLYRRLKDLEPGDTRAAAAAAVASELALGPAAAAPADAGALDLLLKGFVEDDDTRDGRQGRCQAEATVIRKDIPRAPGSPQE